MDFYANSLGLLLLHANHHCHHLRYLSSHHELYDNHAMLRLLTAAMSDRLLHFTNTSSRRGGVRSQVLHSPTAYGAGEHAPVLSNRAYAGFNTPASLCAALTADPNVALSAPALCGGIIPGLVTTDPVPRVLSLLTMSPS